MFVWLVSRQHANMQPSRWLAVVQCFRRILRAKEEYVSMVNVSKEESFIKEKH
jgi:hypothetical protein